jgi:23S rRNA (guanosine2251-2'-O)-methyltransferase
MQNNQMKKESLQDFIIYGRQPVYEALRAGQVIKRIIIARETDKKSIRVTLDLVRQQNIELQFEKKAAMQKYCGPVLHQGIVAFLDDYHYLSELDLMKKLLTEASPFILLLDQIQDPQNLGAIIRSAEIAGVTAVILPEKGSAAITPTVAKTSAGAIFHCPVYRTTDLIGTMGKLKEANLTLYALVANKKETIFESDLKKPLGLVIGSEGRGVRKNVETFCDKAIAIPGIGKIDSLNASVSTAVVLFEVLRQRKYS